MTKLEALERKFPQFKLKSSPTQRIGGEPLNEFNNIKHLIPCKAFQIPIIKRS